MNLKYMKVSLFEMLQEKNELFHDILIYWDAPVCFAFLYCYRKNAECKDFSEPV